MMSEPGYTCTAMDIDQADSVAQAEHVISTHVTLTSPPHFNARKSNSQSLDKENVLDENNTKGTQTPGHVFLGKQGEVIITTNYTLVKLVINNEAVNRLTDVRGASVDQITDIVMTSLARLDWNSERILQKAMTSFRLTLTNDLMPQLLREVAEVLKTEHDHHKVQQLAQNLLEQHLVKLFGMDVRSLIFILEHSSVDDALKTLESPQRREELQGVLLSFLPEWVWPFAVWAVSAYTLTEEDGSGHFGFKDFTEIPMAALVGDLAGTVSGAVASPTLPAQSRETEEDSEPGTSSSVGNKTPEGEDASHFVREAEEGEQASFTKEPRASTCYEASAGMEEWPQGFLSPGTAAAAGVKRKAELDTEMSTGVEAKRMLRLEEIDTDDIPEHEVDLQLVIVGKTGSGKSSTANSILGEEHFPVAAAFTSVTAECQCHSSSRDGTKIQVLDTPGLFDTVLSTQDVSNMVLRAASQIEDGPDAVLYVIKIGGRYTEEEFAVYTYLKALLDENVTRYIIVVFTHGDLLRGQAIEPLLQRPESLATMIKECGNRYVVFDNTADDKMPQVRRLMAEIQRVQQLNGGRRYKCPRYAEKLCEIDMELEVRLLKAEQQRLKGRMYIRTLETQLQQVQQQLEKETEDFGKQEAARKDAMKKREEAMQEQIGELTEALKREQLEEEERKTQVRAVQDRLAQEREQSYAEMRRMEVMQAEEMRRRNEQLAQQMEKLQAERVAAERAAAQRQAEEMARLRMDVARSRRRKDKDCCVM